jgi:SAM-dependent methyltransferase
MLGSLLRHTLEGSMSPAGSAPGTLRRRARNGAYRLLDRIFLPLDKDAVRRTANLRLIPSSRHRIGGKHAYGEWCHVVGIFQTLIAQNLSKRSGNRILDIGCGTGLLAIASEPFISDGGNYTGIDVGKREIAFAREHYPSSHYDFIHSNSGNALYSPDRSGRERWAVEDDTADLVTALSVWTHLNEDDARFYMQEVARALRPGGRAIITFFLVEEDSMGRPEPGSELGRFNRTPAGKWDFSEPVGTSEQWVTPRWANTAEAAIGVKRKGFDSLIDDAGLTVRRFYPGNWKDQPGVYFQDVVVLEHAPR